MTRFPAAAAILICVAVFAPFSAQAQSDRDSSSDSQCFPWQELRDGRCVSKPSQAAPPAVPAPAPIAADPCLNGKRNLSTQCPCPENTIRDAVTGACVAAAKPTATSNDRQANDSAIICDGGTMTGGSCACPPGFNLMAAGGNRAGGTCVRTNAENCLGGELTVTGACLCRGQVVMSGETYLLEYAAGKCVPKRCPVETVQKDGKCVGVSAATANPLPEEKAKPDEPQETSEETGPRHHCRHGMVPTHAGCVAARHRLRVISGNGIYYRLYSSPPN